MTLETSVPDNLDGLEIPTVPTSGLTVEDLNRELGDMSPTLASMLSVLKRMIADPGYLFGAGSDYKIEWLANSIFIGHKDADATAPIAPYVGDLRAGVYVSGTGIQVGYNNPSTGVWELIAMINSLGKFLVGSHSSGSIDPTNVAVSGTTMGDIRTGALRALGAINGSGVVTADVSNGAGSVTTTTLYGSSIGGVSMTLTGNILTLGTITGTVVSCTGFSLNGYALRPFSTTGRLTVYDQTFPYAAVGTFLYEFHL